MICRLRSFHVRLHELTDHHPVGAVSSKTRLRNNRSSISGIGSVGLLFLSRSQALRAIRLAGNGKVRRRQMTAHPARGQRVWTYSRDMYPFPCCSQEMNMAKGDRGSTLSNDQEDCGPKQSFDRRKLWTLHGWEHHGTYGLRQGDGVGS
jgi:hypothetical protein